MSKQNGRMAIPVLDVCNQLFGRTNKTFAIVGPDDGGRFSRSNEAFYAHNTRICVH